MMGVFPLVLTVRFAGGRKSTEGRGYSSVGEHLPSTTGLSLTPVITKTNENTARKFRG